MRATFDVEHASRLRQSETEWLRQSAARLRAAHAGGRPGMRRERGESRVESREDVR